MGRGTITLCCCIPHTCPASFQATQNAQTIWIFPIRFMLTSLQSWHRQPCAPDTIMSWHRQITLLSPIPDRPCPVQDCVMLSPVQVLHDLSSPHLNSAQLTCSCVMLVSLRENGSGCMDLAPEIMSHRCQLFARFLSANPISVFTFSIQPFFHVISVDLNSSP